MDQKGPRRRNCLRDLGRDSFRLRGFLVLEWTADKPCYFSGCDTGMDLWVLRGAIWAIGCVVDRICGGSHRFSEIRITAKGAQNRGARRTNVSGPVVLEQTRKPARSDGNLWAFCPRLVGAKQATPITESYETLSGARFGLGHLLYLQNPHASIGRCPQPPCLALPPTISVLVHDDSGSNRCISPRSIPLVRPYLSISPYGVPEPPYPMKCIEPVAICVADRRLCRRRVSRGFGAFHDL